MGNTTKREQCGGQEFHVADCYVWAEIHYLDSATDYREYLRENVLPQQQSGPGGQPMVLLDNDSARVWSSFAKFFVVWLIPLLVILVIVIRQD
jgi:hypothetical protein